MLEPTNGGVAIELTKSPTRIGRRDTCDVVLDRPKISGHHAELAFDQGTWRIRDLRSRNDVRVNGKRLSSGIPQELCNEDAIELADIEFRFTTR